MDIFIKTVDGRVSENIEVSLIMDDNGMKYTIRDTRTEDLREHRLDVEIPNSCRNEIKRRFIPNVDGKAGVLPKYQAISPVLDKFIFDCWERILAKEPQLLKD